MSKNLVVCADASIRIAGTDYIMRYLALAQAWQEHSADVTFLSHYDSEALHQYIIGKWFEFIPIEKPHPEISCINTIKQKMR